MAQGVASIAPYTPRPSTERIISTEECPELAGWTIKTMYTFRDRSYHSYNAPGIKKKYKSRIDALRAATSTSVACKTKTTPAALAGRYPTRRGDAAKAARSGQSTIHGKTPVRCIDPRRSYQGPQIPRSGRAPAGDDLPGWEIGRMSALDGKEFLLYYDPNGQPVGSRGSALKATGQLFITKQERNATCVIMKDRELRQNLMQSRINISVRGASTIHATVHASANATLPFRPGEFEAILNSRFLPDSTESTCTATLADPCDVRSRVVVVDMFAGCGGMSLGMRGAGYPFVLGIDESAACRASYKANHCGTRSMEQRLRAEDVEAWYSAMENARIVGEAAACELVLLAGPPCQPYSRAGQRAGAADDRDCLPIAITLAIRLRPLIFVLENVVGMLDGEFFQAIQSVIQPLVDSGYTMHASEHKCKNHGVPQLRVRMFVVFTRNQNGDGCAFIPYAQKLHLARTLGSRTSCVFPEDAICEPGFWTGRCPKELELDLPVLKARQRIPGITNCVGLVSARVVAPTVMTSSIKTNSYNRLIALPKDKDASKLLYSDARMLHSRHALLLQTFPPNFKLYGNLSEHSRQIGNAVPPMLAYDLGYGIKNLLERAEGGLCCDTDVIGSCLSVLKSKICELVTP